MLIRKAAASEHRTPNVLITSTMRYI